MNGPGQPNTLRRDLATAYLATGARILSWVIVSALVFRYFRPRYFALLALVRATVGILNYTAVGLTPALIHFLSKASAVRPSEPRGAAPDDSVPQPSEADVIFSSGMLLTKLTCLAAVVLTFVYAIYFVPLHGISWGPSGADRLRGEAFWMVLLIGGGVILRLASDPAAAALQLGGRIATDNVIVTAGEVAWVVLSALWLRPSRETAVPVAASFLVASGAVAAARWLLSSEARCDLVSRKEYVDRRRVRALLAFGAMVMLAQVADFLYAPTDMILINRLINPETVAAYAPAVQVDGGLLLLVGGLSAVLLPKAALAHAGGRRDAVRRYYVAGTVASVALLLAAGGCVWALSPWLLRAWLGSPMPETLAILPWVLVHTVVGGSSAVGRAVLLGMGRVKPFTASVLIAGAMNVVLSYCFVRFGGLGLKGIVLGTIVVVVARCGVWMPWYVMRVLREGAVDERNAVEPLPAPEV